MKISIIGTVGVPAIYGGFESLVDNLLDYTPEDIEYTVFCSAKKYEKRLETYKSTRLVYLDMDANGVSSIFYDFKSMKMSLQAAVMLVLGVSGCIFLPYIRRHFKGKIITNIDGLEWKRDKWNFLAKWLLKKSEKLAVKFSDKIIGDNKAICDYVQSTYKKDAVLIAYGGDNASKVTDNALFEKYPFCKNPYAVTVCRIEPENHIKEILEAFADFADNEPVKMTTSKQANIDCTANKFSRSGDFSLVIVGNWQNSDYGKSLYQKFSSVPNIFMLDAIYAPHEINWLRGNAAVYIHGHSAGGTNPSLVEAMSLELPILAFDCVYNRATTEEKCLYWKNSFDIARFLKENSAEFQKISSEMKEIADRCYSWQTIAEKYNELWKE